ncbi:MAG: hypothetical protein AB1847_09045 [bacterium]
MNKIESLLEKSTEGKKTNTIEEGGFFHSKVYPSKEGLSSSANQRTGTDQEPGNKSRQDFRISLLGLESGRQNMPETTRELKKDQDRKDRQRDDKRSEKNGGSDIQRTGAFIHLNQDSSSSGGTAVAQSGGVSKNHAPQKTPPNSVRPDESQSWLIEDQEKEPGEPVKKPEEESPTPTPWSNEIYGYVNAKEGSWVYAYDSGGKECGRSLVKKDGLYGVIHIYMDDIETTEKEGIYPGESITFKVDGMVATPDNPEQAVCQGANELKRVDLLVVSGTES